jgi:pyrroloquinoline quinone biosynthesis protein E
VIDRPYTLIAELTHRCALACPYCSNPRALVREEIDTDAWKQAIDEAVDLGVMQVSFTGGEPLARRDLEELVAHARAREAYVNVITSGIPADLARIGRLGADHVQLSLQDVDEAEADAIAGHPAHGKKLEVARCIVGAGMSLSINVVIHRGNADRVDRIVSLAEELGADRLELANVQFLGWAHDNRLLLLPTHAQIEAARAAASRAKIAVAFVTPDHFTGRPRACMDGWGRRFLHIAPDGAVLPCHAARNIPGLSLERVGSRSLEAIWSDGPDFQAFRGESWMREPCRSCDRRGIDFGGCRCQAFALTGDASATDPACALSPEHALVRDAHRRAGESRRVFVFRGR